MIPFQFGNLSLLGRPSPGMYGGSPAAPMMPAAPGMFGGAMPQPVGGPSMHAPGFLPQYPGMPSFGAGNPAFPQPVGGPSMHAPGFGGPPMGGTFGPMPPTRYPMFGGMMGGQGINLGALGGPMRQPY